MISSPAPLLSLFYANALILATYNVHTLAGQYAHSFIKT